MAMSHSCGNGFGVSDPQLLRQTDTVQPGEGRDRGKWQRLFEVRKDWGRTQNFITISGPLKILLSVDISHLSWGHSEHGSVTTSANLNYRNCSLAPPLCQHAACTGCQLGELIQQNTNLPNPVYLQRHLHPKWQLCQLTCLHAFCTRQVGDAQLGIRQMP